MHAVFFWSEFLNCERTRNSQKNRRFKGLSGYSRRRLRRCKLADNTRIYYYYFIIIIISLIIIINAI